jgi:hypothetical protein
VKVVVQPEFALSFDDMKNPSVEASALSGKNPLDEKSPMKPSEEKKRKFMMLRKRQEGLKKLPSGLGL